MYNNQAYNDMPPLKILICPLCQEEYNDNERKPMIGMCGHTICACCRNNLSSFECPVSSSCRQTKKTLVKKTPFECFGRGYGEAFIVPTKHFQLEKIRTRIADRRIELNKAMNERKQMRIKSELAEVQLEIVNDRLIDRRVKIQELEEELKNVDEKMTCTSCGEYVVELIHCEYCDPDKTKEICVSCYFEDHTEHICEESEDELREISVITLDDSEIIIDEEMRDGRSEDAVVDTSIDIFDESDVKMEVESERNTGVIFLNDTITIDDSVDYGNLSSKHIDSIPVESNHEKSSTGVNSLCLPKDTKSLDVTVDGKHSKREEGSSVLLLETDSTSMEVETVDDEKEEYDNDGCISFFDEVYEPHLTETTKGKNIENTENSQNSKGSTSGMLFQYC